MKTLLLDRTQWDLVLDANGNIALATEPYARAQDVASACRLFRGELWYDTAAGIPYFEDILGKSTPASLLKAKLEEAALTVPGVGNVQIVLQSLENRKLSGQILFTDAEGNSNQVAF